MAKITIKESGMEFGPFDSDMVYRIENSQLHKSVGEGVKIVEFIVKEDEILLAVEAKSSSPKPGNDVDFNKFIRELEEKFSNAMILLSAAVMGRHGKSLPTAFTSIGLNDTVFHFTLVVKGHEMDWLPPIQVALQNILRRYMRCYGGKNRVSVLNDEIARRKGLIV